MSAVGLNYQICRDNDNRIIPVTNSPENDDVFSPEPIPRHSDPQFNLCVHPVSGNSPIDSSSHDYYSNSMYSMAFQSHAHDMTHQHRSMISADSLDSQSISPSTQHQLSATNNHGGCERFDEILKKVEERNSESSSFSEPGQAFNSSGELENSTLSSFTQLMSHSFTSSFDTLTGSLSDNNSNESYLRDKPQMFHPDTIKPPQSPTPIPTTSIASINNVTSNNNHYDSTSGPPSPSKLPPCASSYYHPTNQVDPNTSSMYYHGYWGVSPYTSKEYLSRLYYAQRYNPYTKSNSASSYPFNSTNAYNNKSSPMNHNSINGHASYSGYPMSSSATYPCYQHAPINGPANGYDVTPPHTSSTPLGGNLCLGLNTVNKYYSSTSSSLSPTDSPRCAIGGLANNKRSGRRKKRSSQPSATTEPQITRVFVWDLDETAIILLSLLNGTYASTFNHDAQLLQELGMQMDDIIYSLVNSHFFFKELDECDQIHFDDVAIDDNGIDLSTYDFTSDGFLSTDIQTQPLRGNNTVGSNTATNNSTTTTTTTTTTTNNNNNNNNSMLHAPLATSQANAGMTSPMTGVGASLRNTQEWCKKLAYRYRRIQDIYTKCGHNLESLLGQDQYTVWYKLLCKLENITEQWVSQTRKCLGMIQATPGYINIIVSSSPLILTLGKCLLFGLSLVFQAENIYSSHKVGKVAVFERLINRFGHKCTYVSIGDSLEDEEASKKHSFPFWRINSQSDLFALERALHLGHL